VAAMMRASSGMMGSASAGRLAVPVLVLGEGQHVAHMLAASCTTSLRAAR
jgi:hypothetical protein